MIIKRAYAKINLILDVLSRREDGYHELTGIMHRISLYDEVGVKPASSACISVRSDITLPKDNTAYKAAYGYMQAAGINDGLDIIIKKNIPSEAGLGGASADAAAVLEALQEIYGALSESELYSVGKAVGADVPFCLKGGCCEVRGIGEKLNPLPRQKLYLVLVMGDTGISTGNLFALHDELCGGKAEDPRLKSAIIAAKSKNSELFINSLFNTLEGAAFGLMPQLAVTKDRLLSMNGIKDALMTGSGAVVYGVFESMECAENAASIMREYGYKFVQTAETI